MDKHIISFFSKQKLVLKNKTIVVAVSTGVDSMVLLYALLLLKEEFNLNINVAHFNHQKREQSIEEEKYIKSFCKKQEINCFVEKLKKDASSNFQSYAREQRYLFFKRVMDEVNGDYLFLAHHNIDNMETIIMRIIRGSNLKGYSGMDSVSYFHEKLIIRPFLDVLKEDIIDFANKHNIKYYQDESNFEDVYTRNRIRKEIIPQFFKEDENVNEKFNEFAETLKEANSLVEEKVKEFINSSNKTEETISFERNRFLEYSLFLQTEILFYILKKYYLSKANILELIKVINSNKKNIKVINDDYSLVKEYDKITFFYKKLEIKNIDINITNIGNYKVNDTISINVMKKNDAYIPNKDDLWYNSNKFPIRIRSRKNGDKILLDSGYKKVKDLLIDLKIGIIKRDEILIAEKDNEILAVIGVKKSYLLKNIDDNDIIIRVENKNG